MGWISPVGLVLVASGGGTVPALRAAPSPLALGTCVASERVTNLDACDGGLR